MSIRRIGWRKYAYQVVLLEELAKHGVAVVFLNHQQEGPASPEQEMLLQMQGMFAEYEPTRFWSVRVGDAGMRPGAARSVCWLGRPLDIGT